MEEEIKLRGTARLLYGKERYTENARVHTAGRLNLFWAIFKGRFGRLMLINLIMLACCLPVIAIVIYRNLAFSAQEMLGPYGAGLMVGYPVIPNIIGYAEQHILYNDNIFFSLLIPASALAAVGISGGMYLIRNLIRTEGVYYFSDFGKGIKNAYLCVLEGALIFTIILFLAQITGNLSNLYTAIGDENATLMFASKIIGYTLMSLVLLVALWMVSVGVNYKLGPWGLLRSAVVLTFRTFPFTVIFAAAAFAPIFLLLFTSGFLLAIGIVFYMLFGFSYGMLVWMSFTQWIFDRYYPQPEVEEKDAKGNTQASAAASQEKARDYRRLLLAQGRSILFSRPVQPMTEGSEPYVLPDEFSREDLKKIAQSRAVIESEVQAYEDAHKDEEKYVDFSKQLEGRDTALEKKDGKKKTPKRPPKMLNRR